MSKEQIFEVYTDGACSGNPGPGGWGFVIITPDGEEIRRNGGNRNTTTNNRMEMRAMLYALRAIVKLNSMSKYQGVKWVVYTDSSYVHKGLTEWIHGWIGKNWRGVKNSDIWSHLWDVYNGMPADVTIKWVRGHADSYGNNLADTLAREGLEDVRQD